MSDRDAFEKWIANKTYVIETPDVRINVKGMAWEAWQAAQDQAVNQQTLSSIINLMIAVKGAIRLGCYHEAYEYLNAAIAAAQENR